MLKLLEMPLLDSPLASELAVLLEHLTPCELPLRLGALPGPASGTAKAWIGRTARSHDQAGSIPWDADSLLTALLAFDEAADEAGTDGGSTDLATGASRFTMRMQLVHARGRSLIGRLLVAAVAISKVGGPRGPTCC